MVAFNEYFFGKTPFLHSIAEAYAKSFSCIHSNYLFACNFLTHTVNFTKDQANKNIDIFYENKKQEVVSELLEEVEEAIEKEEDKDALVTTAKKTRNRLMLENKTFYTLQGNVTSTYNKSSYCDEHDDFLKRRNAFYHFGDWKDHSIRSTQHQITNYISSEICKDLNVGLRQNDNVTILHLIQANTLRGLIQYKNKLPLALCYIFCDPCVMRKDIATRKCEELGHIYLTQSEEGHGFYPWSSSLCVR